jgi:hypothetical protein
MKKNREILERNKTVEKGSGSGNKFFQPPARVDRLKIFIRKEED